jgi:hypothetical protein
LQRELYPCVISHHIVDEKIKESLFVGSTLNDAGGDDALAGHGGDAGVPTATEEDALGLRKFPDRDISIRPVGVPVILVMG